MHRRPFELKASGPLLDRLDFVLTLKSVLLTQETAAETSDEIRVRTEKAHELQRARYKSAGLNGTVPGALLLATCGLTEPQTRSLQEVCYKEKWSNRTQVKLIRIARTIADLEGTETISEKAIQEAVHWKRLASLHQEEQRSQG